MSEWSLWTILAPAAFVACANTLVQNGDIAVHEYPTIELQQRCAEGHDPATREWRPSQVGVMGCLKRATWTVLLDADLRAYPGLSETVLQHEAAHLCGWKNDHRGDAYAIRFNTSGEYQMMPLAEFEAAR